MAKTDFPTWMKFVLMALTLVGIVFGWGATHNAGQARMENMEEADIVLAKADVEFSVEIKEIKENVHRIELDSKDIKNLAAQSVAAFIEVKSIMKEMQKTQSDQATIQAVNSAKLDSLTKD